MGIPKQSYRRNKRLLKSYQGRIRPSTLKELEHRKPRSTLFCTKMNSFGNKDLNPFDYLQVIKTPKFSTNRLANNAAEIIYPVFRMWTVAGKHLRTRFHRWQKTISTISSLQKIPQIWRVFLMWWRRFTTEMNNFLLQSYTAEEVRQALFQMHPSKSPVPDGMSPFFFQKF